MPLHCISDFNYFFLKPHANFSDQDNLLDEAIVAGYKSAQGNFIDKLEIFLKDFVNNTEK